MGRFLEGQVVAAFSEESLELIGNVLDPQMKRVDLNKKVLLFLPGNLDLLDEVLSSGTLVLTLLNESQSLVCLDDFALALRDDSLELLPLPGQLVLV